MKNLLLDKDITGISDPWLDDEFYDVYGINFGGGGKGGSDVPPPPPSAGAIGQIRAQQFITPTQFTPYGNLRQGTLDASGNFVPFSGTETIPIRNNKGKIVDYETVPSGAMRLELTPEMQALFDRDILQDTALADLALALTGQLEANRLDLSGLPSTVANIDDSSFASAGQEIEQATFDRAMNLLQPQFDIEDRRLEQELANTGAPLASQLAKDRAELFDQRRADILGNVALGAVGAGRDEQSRLFQQALMAAELQNAARATGIGEQLTSQSFDFNQLASLLGLSQIQQPNLGSFFAPPAPNAYQAFANETNQNALIQNAEVQNARNRAGIRQSIIGGLADLGSAAIPVIF